MDQVYLDDLLLPLAPTSYNEIFEKEYETEEFMYLGERDFLQDKKKLPEFTIKSYIPVTGLYFSNNELSANEVRAILEEKSQSKNPNRLIMAKENFNNLVNFTKYSMDKDAENPNLLEITLDFRLYYDDVKIDELAPKIESKKPQLNIDRKDKETSGTKYKVKSGDSLWVIAEKYYGDGSQYKKIYEANKELIINENEISIGWEIIIP